MANIYEYVESDFLRSDLHGGKSLFKFFEISKVQ